jgi:hypothetical protein
MSTTDDFNPEMTSYDARNCYAVVVNIALYFGDDFLSVEYARAIARPILAAYTRAETANLCLWSKCDMILTEGIFRKPRLRSNEVIRRFSHLFTGVVVNVSGSSDSDKDCSLRDYYAGNYDAGRRYKSYFPNASSYRVTNFPGDKTDILLDREEFIELDLEGDLRPELVQAFDVVFNHTVLEHVFDVFKAFENLCRMSRDVVLLVVPQSQRIHDYGRGYADYWRFTPFAIDRLFDRNGFTTLFRETTRGLSESQYLVYIASRNPQDWIDKFPPLKPPEIYLDWRNDGASNTLLSLVLLNIDNLIRRALRILDTKRTPA